MFDVLREEFFEHVPAPVEVGQEIELSLQFEKADGSKIEMPVKAVAGQNAAGDHHSLGGGGDHKH